MAEQARIELTAVDRASATLNAVQARFVALTGTLSTFTALAPVAALTAIAAGLKGLVTQLDDLEEAAQGVGVTARSLAELRQAAQFSGVGAQQLDKALSGLSTRLADAARGGRESAALFNALGVSVRDNGGALRAADDVLADIADRFATYRDGAEKTALANQIFGDKLGRVVIPYLNQGSAALKQFSGVTDESVASAAKLQGEFDKLSASANRFSNSVASAVVPAINSIIETSRRVDFTRLFNMGPGAPSALEFALAIGRATREQERLNTQLEEALRLGEGVYSNEGRSRQSNAPIVDAQAAAAAEAAAKKAVEERAKAEKAAYDQRIEIQAATTRGFIDQLAAEEAATTARQRSIEAQALADQQFIDGQNTRLTVLQEALAGEEEIERRRFELRMEFLDELANTQPAREAEINTLRLQVEQEYQDRLVELQDQTEAKRFGISRIYRKLDLDSAGAFLGQMSSLMNSKSRSMFEVGKAAAIGQTVIDTYRAAQGAYAALAGIPIVGPALGAAAAAAAVVSGIANVQRIRSTSFGGGAQTSASAVTTPGQGPFSAGAAPVPVQPAAAAPRSQVINLTLAGSGRYSADEVRGLIEQINEQLGLGAVVQPA